MSSVWLFQWRLITRCRWLCFEYSGLGPSRERFEKKDVMVACCCVLPLLAELRGASHFEARGEPLVKVYADSNGKKWFSRTKVSCLPALTVLYHMMVISARVGQSNGSTVVCKSGCRLLLTSG